jgi:hypothetical protein
MYAEWSLQQNWQITAGLFVDGWGPAEFVNPSNTFFHLNLNNKNFSYKEKGKVLTKAVWNPTAKSTIVLIAEPLSNNEAVYMDGKNFSPSTALRAEWQSDDVSQLWGIVLGTDYLGEYMQLASPSTGFSVYFEGRHNYQAQRYNVEGTSGAYALNLRTTPGYTSFSDLGLRWEDHVDIRAEWIFYELGYSEAEWNQIVLANSQLSQFLAANLGHFQALGLEFMTKNWLSLSMRIPDLGPKANWQWTNRLLGSVGDSFNGNLRAAMLQSDLEIPAFEAWTLYGQLRAFSGNQNSDLMLSSINSVYLGARVAW